MFPTDKSEDWYDLSSRHTHSRRPHGAKIRVVIVDDHVGYRGALKSNLEMEGDVEVVGEAATGQEALEVAKAQHPDIILMDINMPGMSGMQATHRLADAYPDIRIVTLTMYKDEEHLKEARRAGASAYVMKDAPTEALLQLLHEIMDGETPLLEGDAQTNTITAEPEHRATPSAPGLATGNLLSPKERTLLRLLGTGAGNDEIAEKMGVQASMVRTYLFEICRKLGLSDRTAAVEYARTRLDAQPSGPGE